MRWIAAATIVALCAAQVPAAHAQASSDATVVTVPAATRIQLKLVSEIHNRSTKPGDAVRAQVSFPVMAGGRVAIPADTWAEGTVLSVNALGKNHQPEVHLHFTQLVFANGYSIPLDAANTQAVLLEPELGRTRATYQLADARDGMPMLGEGTGQTTTTPSLPSNGPSPGVLAGIGFGSAAAIGVIAILAARHHATHADYLLVASGWQFEIELAQPLTLDTARIAIPAASTH